MQKPESLKGLARLVRSFFYSMQGLKSCFKNEEAFRLEAILFVVLLVVIAVIEVSPLLKLMLFCANSLVLIVELLNSAVEAVVDKASPEYHELAGRAKDMGSAAVFISLLAAGVVWAYAVFLALAA